MSFFDGLGQALNKGFANPNFGDSMAEAQAFLNGDYGAGIQAAAKIYHRHHAGKGGGAALALGLAGVPGGAAASVMGAVDPSTGQTLIVPPQLAGLDPPMLNQQRGDPSNLSFGEWAGVPGQAAVATGDLLTDNHIDQLNQAYGDGGYGDYGGFDGGDDGADFGF